MKLRYFLSKSNLGGNTIWKYNWRIIKMIEKLESALRNEKPALELKKGGNIILLNHPINKESLNILKQGLKDESKRVSGGQIKLYGIIDGEEVEISLSKIKKTAEFGGASKGSGAGAEITKLSECAVCCITPLILKYKNAKNMIEKLSLLSENEMIEELNSVSNNFDINISINNIASFLCNNHDWLKSSCYSAELIKKELGIELNSVFHRGSKLIKKLNDKVLFLIKKDKYISKLIKNINKWNPADIWKIDKFEEAELIKILDNIESLSDFNDYLLQRIKTDKKVVGILLKKTDENSKVKYYNVNNTGLKVYLGEINVNILESKNILTKDIYLISKDKKVILQIRDFNNRIGGIVQGELKGKLATAGKIGGKIMINWIKQNYGSDIKIFKEKDMYDFKTNTFNKYFVNFFYNVIEKLKKNKYVDEKHINKIRNTDDLLNLLNNLRDKFYKEKKFLRILSSKIQALQIASYADDEFFNFVRSYAASNIIGVSAPFIKIGG